ncbi:maleylpyruvate isomerase family mycothiol-dependent enzyme [Citricoccus sp. NPDC055426]|uniref:maleylpyruvate isomerase family mycothiol-dependent enzyme n=1 Tax=Citricoccus sp. NPDC055426 TaxID=3155536 RepID=UPI00343DE425
MINPARLHSDQSRLDRETAMLLATVESLSEDELAAPSQCEGWSRANVVAHLASNARALVRMVDWAVTGGEQSVYSSPEARAEDIARIAAMPRKELIADLVEASRFFAEQSERLAGEIQAEEVRIGATPIPATSLVAVRISEVVVHHADLDTAWTIEEADPDSLLNAVEAAVRAMRTRNAPGMTLVTEERDEWIIGDGALKVDSDREGLLAWLARGDAGGVEADGPLPELPAW